MRNLVIGFIIGLVVATVGFSGAAQIADNGIDRVKFDLINGMTKIQSKELAK